MKQRSNILALLLAFALALDIGLHLHNPFVLAQLNQPPANSLTAATTGTGTAIATNNALQVGWSVLWATSTSAGEVVIEAANTSTYAGTWAEIDRQAVGSAPTPPSMMTGTYPGPLQFTRCRVTTTVVGGNVTCSINRINGH